MKILISAYVGKPYSTFEAGKGWNWIINNAQLGHEVVCLTEIGVKEYLEYLTDIDILQFLRFLYCECNGQKTLYTKSSPETGTSILWI